MKELIKKARSLANSGEIEGGQGTTEYVLIIAFVVVGIIIAIGTFGTNLNELWGNANGALQDGIDQGNH